MRPLRRVAAGLALWRLFGPMVGPRFRVGQEHPWRVPGRTVLVGDRELLVRQAGREGAPDLVLVHGLGGSSLAEWYEIGPRLQDRFRLTMVDHRSHGLSARQTSRFEVEDMADDVAAVMAEVGVVRADVAGYSMGAAVAQAMAHRHPHVVERLVLIAAFSHHPLPWRLARQAGALLTRAWERATGTGTPEVRAGYLIATGAVQARHARWMWEETHRRDPEAGAAAALALLRFDSRPWVGRLDVPSLVVIPTSDQLVPSRWQYELAASLRKVRVVELHEARHEAPWTHPDEVAAAMAEFLAGEEGSGEGGIEGAEGQPAVP